MLAYFASQILHFEDKACVCPACEHNPEAGCTSPFLPCVAAVFQVQPRPPSQLGRHETALLPQHIRNMWVSHPSIVTAMTVHLRAQGWDVRGPRCVNQLSMARTTQSCVSGASTTRAETSWTNLDACPCTSIVLLAMVKLNIPHSMDLCVRPLSASALLSTAAGCAY